GTMSYRFLPVVAVASVALAAAAAAQDARYLASQLMSADLAFSKVGAKANIAESIGAMLTDNAVMPTPKLDFAIGKAAIIDALKAIPANANATAESSPVRAGISADGTQGFTYGFMFIHESGKPDRRAKYLSYWVKRPEGWRVAFYNRAESHQGTVTTRMDPAVPEQMIDPDPPRLHDTITRLTD